MALSWLAAGFGWALLVAVLVVLPVAVPRALIDAGGQWAIWLPAVFGVSADTGGIGTRAASVLVAVLVPGIVQGLLARLAFPARSRWGVPFSVLLAAVWGGSFVLLLAGIGPDGRWQAPVPLALLLPGIGLAAGLFLGGALRPPGFRILPALLGRALVVAVVMSCLLLVGYLLARSGDSESVPPARVEVAAKRALIERLRAANPLALASGQAAVVEFSGAELQALLRWLAQLLAREPRAELVTDQGVTRFRIAIQPAEWLAVSRPAAEDEPSRPIVVSGLLALGVRDSRLQVSACGLALGQVVLPPTLCEWLVQSGFQWLARHRDYGPFVRSIDWLTLDGRGLMARYQGPVLDADALARLQRLTGADERVAAAVAAQFEALRATAPRLAGAPDRLGAVVRAAFALASARSASGGAAAENQAALVAVATLLGHEQIAALAGVALPQAWEGLRDQLMPVALRGRPDWARHFLVSAALVPLSHAAMSDAVGRLKEDLDAVEGSGFSFGDLLADRAGARFGALATRSEAEALALQARLARGWVESDFMPEAADLPEGLADTELAARFGGADDPRQRALMAVLETRLAALPPLLPVPE